ncbi:MAG TPA: homoserine dehydrogenase [Candidatus Nitrosotalea sp.]|nr:homoserine dehydrogenase [Candidatus Nitrosotalea sp.]
MKSTIGIGLLGCGTVGSSVAERLSRERNALAGRAGACFELRAIAIHDPRKERAALLDRRLFSTDARAVIDDPRVDLVVELIGGEGEAGAFVERALQRGRHVVTANKDLLATRGPGLRALAASAGAALRYEAAVGGAIPIVRTLTDALAGDAVLAVAGVINGTCTSILSAMEEGAAFEEALVCAQRLGFAEVDPSSDVAGNDAAHKLAILSQLAFGAAVISPRIRRRGIGSIARRDVARARMAGLRIRLVAAAILTERGILAEVAPVLVGEDHEFARTSGAENAVIVKARDAGDLVLRGLGAGGDATASAVLGDVVTLVRALGERRNPSFAAANVLQPAMEVEPFFASLARAPEVAEYPIWDDRILDASLRSAVRA